jgi:hypothetical protein
MYPSKIEHNNSLWKYLRLSLFSRTVTCEMVNGAGVPICPDLWKPERNRSVLVLLSAVYTDTMKLSGSGTHSDPKFGRKGMPEKSVPERRSGLRREKEHPKRRSGAFSHKKLPQVLLISRDPSF